MKVVNYKINYLIKITILSLIVFVPFYGGAQKKIRIACVGNSITQGAGVENPKENSFPAQLASMLGDAYEVQNFGRSGATLIKKGDLPYWETGQYQGALKFNPDMVFIKLGTNDTKPQNRIYLDSDYINDYKDLIASFQQLSSKPRVVLIVPVPVFSTGDKGISSGTLEDIIIPKVRQIAYETGCEIINMYNHFLDLSELVPDKVHPNSAGAKIIARRLYEYVKMQSDNEFTITDELPSTDNPFNFHGFQGYDFTFQGKNAKVVIPKHAAPDHPWIWRARFWGHEPQADIALLERGFHIVYCDVAELFGNDEALSIWDAYYQMLTGAGLAKKSVMEGMSRGGMYIYRWAAKYPDRVAGIYGDAPVLDIKSWPGGKGSGPGSQGSWEEFKKDFGFTSEEEALKFKGSPLDLAEEIAHIGFPMLHVVGDADDVVPVDENTGPFEQRVLSAGGTIKVIHKPGIGHHPHCLPNPKPIVDFALMATDYLAKQAMIPLPSEPQLRWQEYERLMFIHFAPNTWTGLSQDDNSLPLDRINPKKIDTDQWCKVAKSWDAKMIVFVAKHSGGFCWWQTNTSEYSARNIPWRNGEGDLLADISKSCEKYGLELGVYIYPGDKTWGAGLGSGGQTKDPSKQEAYNKVFRKQLTEVLANYKPMKEVWFDGSCVINIADLLKKYASDAVIFQGPEATIRWVGNEKGIVPYPNWYTVEGSSVKTGRSTALSSDPDGEVFAPVEVDVPFLMNDKGYRWFWAPKTDSMILSVPGLVNIYNKSIGRGSVLLLNATPDTTGLIPKSHVKRYKEFGKQLDKLFANPIASTSGNKYVLELDLGKAQSINYVVIEEAIANGQRVRKYQLEGLQNDQWVTISEGQSIGNKRIDEFQKVEVSKIRLRITEAIATPMIEKFSVYFNEDISNSVSQEGKDDVPVTIKDWSSSDFNADWQEYTVDLSPYLVEYVGQVQLKFHVVDHDRAFEKSGSGGYGLELKDSYFEVNGAKVPDAVTPQERNTFLISHSQHITKLDNGKMIFKTMIKTKPGRSMGTVEIKKIEFK